MAQNDTTLRTLNIALDKKEITTQDVVNWDSVALLQFGGNAYFFSINGEDMTSILIE